MQIVHCLKVCACILPDCAVLTLREEMPSADGCGDLFLERPMEGLLPLGCGAEAVFNFSWEKEVDPFGSGDDDDDDDDKDQDKDGDDKSDHKLPTSAGTTIIPTRALLSTTANFHTNRSTSSVGVRNASVTPNRSVTRLPPRFTPSLESRYSSFQHLLRLHMNTFNQRLSMLERNTLDMKESVQRIEDQQKLLSSQLTDLISIQSTAEKNQRVTELEKGYSDMESRLNRLEGRLEILIDGFTALAQEMNKMKRARHGSRSPHERRALPLATVLPLPLYTTTHPPVRVTERPFSTRAPVPESIPTPGLPATKVTSRKLKPAATNTSVKSTTPLLSVTKTSKNQVSTRSRVKLKTTLRKPTSKSTSQATEKAETKRPERRRSTVTPKQVLQPTNTKPKEAQKESAVTKFQLEPPSYSPTPAKPDQTRRKNSTIPRKSNRHNKAFRSDAPDPKKAQEAVKTSEGNSKKLAEAHKGNSNQKKIHRNSQSFPPKTNNSTQSTITTAKPTKATTAKKPNTTERRESTSPKAKATTAKKKSNTTVKRKSSTAKTKKNTAKKVTKKIQQKKSLVVDLMQLLNSDHKSAKQQKNRESSLHVVLGRLAIPIKIIPDF